MSAWEGSRMQEAMEHRPPAPHPASAEIKIEDAIRLLSGAGYNVTRKQGQGVIQLVRKRKVAEDPYWRYTVNKYEKRYFPEPGEEVETLLLDVNKATWEKHEATAGSATASPTPAPGGRDT